MTTRTLPTATLPPVPEGPAWLPGPGMYMATGDRCVVELTARLGPLVTLRRRLAADEAALTVAPTAADCVLSLKLTGAALGGEALSFVSTAVEPEAQGSRLRLPGELATADPTMPAVPATLTLRVVERADDSLLVLGTTHVPYGPLRRSTGFTLSRIRPADRLRLLVAAEFTCPV
ncbi:hypothetical protein [Streptomyces sp. NBC_01361]|uniref:hypothetical protein n=1 Tax=Streptomyces sp. NBC_01361 TaxID=2903838 RepID=UPI002E3653D5|nr:hypothetical protein [Streptomyces sp. NBC_01361]